MHNVCAVFVTFPSFSHSLSLVFCSCLSVRLFCVSSTLSFASLKAKFPVKKCVLYKHDKSLIINIFSSKRQRKREQIFSKKKMKKERETTATFSNLACSIINENGARNDYLRAAKSAFYIISRRTEEAGEKSSLRSYETSIKGRP